MTVRVGLKHSGQDCTIDQLRTVWRIADEAGFDHLWAFDHLASIGPGGPDRPIFEGWSLLAAMAVATSRPRLGLMVTGNTYRHPGLLAKIAVTVDHLSGGRLEFGIGAAWAEIEHRMLGLPSLENRVGRLSESLRIIRSLWTEERTTFEGRYYRLDDAIANPKPVQRPHPPIWIGAGGEQTMKLVARHADVWNPSTPGGGSVLDKTIEMSRRLDQMCAEIGRDPASIRRSVQLRWQEPAAFVTEAQRHVEAGFTDVIVMVAGAEAPQQAEQAAEQVLPELRRLG